MYNTYHQEEVITLYNTEVKEYFLRCIDDQQRLQKDARTVFEAIGNAEREYDSDIGFLPHSQRVELFNTIDITSLQSAQLYARVLNKYVRWLSSIHTNRQFDVTELNARSDFDFVSAIQKSHYKSFVDIIDDVSNLYEYDQGYVSMPSLCFAWLGVATKDAPLIKNTDVDLMNGVLTYNGTFIKIEPFMLSILRQYCKTDVAERKQHYTTHVVYKLTSDYFLYKMVTVNSAKQPTPVSVNSMVVAIQDLKDLLPNGNASKEKLTYNNVYRSGGYARLYKLEKQGVKIAIENERLIKKAFGSAGMQFTDLTFQYQAYKKAFNLE